MLEKPFLLDETDPNPTGGREMPSSVVHAQHSDGLAARHARVVLGFTRETRNKAGQPYRMEACDTEEPDE